MAIEIAATTRKAQGTGASRRLRKANRVPGIVYGTGEASMIELDHNTLYYALRNEAFHASVLALDLDGKKQSVLLRDFQMHPFRQQVLHIDFQRVDAKKKIHMKVPLHFINADDRTGRENRRRQHQPRDDRTGNCLPARGSAGRDRSGLGRTGSGPFHPRCPTSSCPRAWKSPRMEHTLPKPWSPPCRCRAA